MLLNYFLSDIPFLAKVERLLSPIATAPLCFRTDLDARLLLERARLRALADFARSTRRKSGPSSTAGGMTDERASRKPRPQIASAFVGERVNACPPPSRLARCWRSEWKRRSGMTPNRATEVSLKIRNHPPGSPVGTPSAMKQGSGRPPMPRVTWSEAGPSSFTSLPLSVVPAPARGVSAPSA
jgi:hypothetical protein